MSRVAVLKTYKLYIGGQFPRTESGRYYTLSNAKKKEVVNVCLSSRKDVRNAVTAARKAFGSWSEKTAFNRGQIVYRMAEMLEGRKAQFEEELQWQGYTAAKARKEVQEAIDLIVAYAGWTDKFQVLASTVNPVSGPYFNFSAPEPMGVVGLIAPEKSGLLGLLHLVLPCIAGGNTALVLASETLPLCAITLAEVMATSDMTAGVVNVLTGQKKELLEVICSHLDVNAVVYAGNHKEEIVMMEKAGAENVKRCFVYDPIDLSQDKADPERILDLQEIKTTWHPVSFSMEGGAAY